MATTTKPEPTGVMIPETIATGLTQAAFDKQELFRADLQQAMPQLLAVLPKGVRGETLAAMALTAALDNPALLDCKPLSLVRATLKVGVLGLRIGETCDIVPIGGKAECWVRVKGVVELAIRAGAIRYAREGFVCAGDDFEYEERDTGTHFRHRAKVTPLLDGSNLSHVYAIITLRDGTRVFEVWTIDRVLAHKKKHAKDTKPGSVWDKHPLPMMAKTVVKAALRFAPLSAEVRGAMQDGDEVEGSYEILDDPTAALQGASGALAALSSGADSNGAVKDPTDGLTLTEALDMTLPGTAEHFKGFGGKALRDARPVLLDVETWYNSLKNGKREQYARLNAAVQMVANHFAGELPA